MVLLVGACSPKTEETTAPRPETVEQVADRLVATFMERHEVPGLSIAIAKDGLLVFANGYGHTSIEGTEPVTPDHLFRIASISKPITAVAILRLVEEGRLSLDQKVFGEGALLGTTYGTQPYSEWIRAITVAHLLDHTAGGWNNKRNDPMFGNKDFDHEQLINWVLDNRPPENEPGTHHDYSNFGFCLLGRVIEVVHRKPYEESVRELVLDPGGIRDMHIAGDTRDEARENEVAYGRGGERPYSIPVARMDAHGGWIASPTDLLRFVTRVDGFDTVPDLLKPETIQTMSTPAEASPPYAKGWAINPADNWWHSGSLPGTGSILVRAHNGFCWAVVTNHRGKDTFGADLDLLTWWILREVREWPEGMLL